MNKSAGIWLLFLVSFQVLAQEIYVPFRVGNQFGLANRAGEIVLKPQFDILEPQVQNGESVFQGYRFEGSKILSSFILKNKIILKDQVFDDYYLDGNLILATNYLVSENAKNYSINAEIPQDCQVFTFDGKPIFSELKNDIQVNHEIHQGQETKQNKLVLLFVQSKSKTYALHLFDKKKSKITKTFFENVTLIDVNYIYNYDIEDRSISYIIKNNQNENRLLKVTAKDGLISLTSNEIVEIKPKQKSDNDYLYDNVAVPPMPREAASIPSGQKAINSVRKVAIKRGYYFLPKKTETIYFTNKRLDSDEGYVLAENEKVGYYSVSSNKLMVPVLYDEILHAEFQGRNGGYILRNGTQYGLYIYDYPNNKTIEPIFAKVPLLMGYDYFGPKDPLIALYDENNQFFCYANQDGTLYYKP
uniref:hypothetical protein n=1 Tax=Flavobacterium sp. TaxID=239 RepID=UPI0040493A0C